MNMKFYTSEMATSSQYNRVTIVLFIKPINKIVFRFNKQTLRFLSVDMITVFISENLTGDLCVILYNSHLITVDLNKRIYRIVM